MLEEREATDETEEYEEERECCGRGLSWDFGEPSRPREAMSSTKDGRAVIVETSNERKPRGDLGRKRYSREGRGLLYD